MRSNAKNTPYMMKSLLGKNFSDPEVQEEMKKLPFKLVPMENDHIGISVFYNGENRVLTPEHITAILLNHCCDLAKKASKHTGNSDVVISVPPFWNDAQRRAMYHASQIAGVRCLRLLNENVATALDYGIFRNLKGEFSDKPVYVLFVDMGYTATHATVAAFTSSKVKIMSCAYDRHLGSRTCDEVIADFIAKGFIAKYKSDPRTNVRAMAKLLVAAEKTKKTLSPAGVTKAPIYIECLFEDRDYQTELTLKDFQSLCSEKQLPERLQSVALQAVKEAGLTVKDLSVCEIIGGGMRVPQMKQALATALGYDVNAPNMGLSTTLNMDETVARGCALQCAILSPRMRVKPYEIVDRIPYPIYLISNVDGKESKMDLYKKGDEFPAYRRVSFHTKNPINLRIEYTEEALKLLMPGTHPLIASTTINMTKKVEEQQTAPAIVCTFCYDAHGLCYLYNAQAKIQLPPEPEVKPEAKPEAKQETKQETKPEEKPEAKSETKTEAKMDVEGEEKEEKPTSPKPEEKPASPKPEEKKEPPKPKYEYDPLSVVSQFSGLLPNELKAAEDAEKKMLKQDADIRARNHAKNELESYIYNMRDKVTSSYKAYILENDRESFLQELETAENWLYDDEGYSAKQEAFEERLSKLQEVGNPVVMRYTEAQGRPEAVSKLSERLETVVRLLDTPNEKYDHITAEDKKPVHDLVEESRTWLEKMLVEQSKKNMTDDPVLKLDDINDRLRNVNALFDKVMSKPKPAPKKVETPKSPKEGETPKSPKEGETPKSPKEDETPKSPKEDEPAKSEGKMEEEEKEDDKKMEVE